MFCEPIFLQSRPKKRENVWKRTTVLTLAYPFFIFKTAPWCFKCMSRPMVRRNESIWTYEAWNILKRVIPDMMVLFQVDRYLYVNVYSNYEFLAEVNVLSREFWNIEYHETNNCLPGQTSHPMKWKYMLPTESWPKSLYSTWAVSVEILSDYSNYSFASWLLSACVYIKRNSAYNSKCKTLPTSTTIVGASD